MTTEQYYALLDEKMTIKHQISKLTHTIETLEYQREVFADLLSFERTKELVRANRSVIEAIEALSFLRLSHKYRFDDIEAELKQYGKEKE